MLIGPFVFKIAALVRIKEFMDAVVPVWTTCKSPHMVENVVHPIRQFLNRDTASKQA